MDVLSTNILKNKRTCIFVSPHLDDAMLSAGGLIQYLSKKTKIVIVNVFTESSDERQTLSAWKFVKDMGYKKPSVLFKERRKEDKQAFFGMGIEPINLGFPDALWRKKKGLVAQMFGKVLPEFEHMYPTYRFHMTTGKVANADKVTKEAVTKKLQKIVNLENDPLMFAPLGVGGHVDHCLVRDVCTEAFPNRVIYWSDFPYNARENNEGVPPNGCVRLEFPVKYSVKKSLIRAYKTQVSGLFPGGIIPDHREIFFTAKH